MTNLTKIIKDTIKMNKEFNFTDSLENVVSNSLLQLTVEDRVEVMKNSGAFDSGKSANIMNKMNIKYVISVLEVA